MSYEGFKSQEQPFCRCCGKPIKKRTGTVYMDHEEPKIPRHNSQYLRYVTGVARSKEECQRFTNLQVLSVRYYKTEGKEGTVYSFQEWDGETYEDQFFCNQQCAAHYGTLSCHWHPETATKHYTEAVKAYRSKSNAGSV